jgi:hypothetical protein
MYKRLLEIQVKRTFSSTFKIEKNEVLYYVREIPSQTKYIFQSSKEKIFKRFKKIYKVGIFFNSKEELLRTVSYFVDENAELLMGISFRLSHIYSKTIKEQHDLAVDNLVNYILQTPFKLYEIPKLLDKKKENFRGLPIEVKKIVCIANVKRRKIRIKSSFITTLTKELLFFYDAIKEKKEKVCKCPQAYNSSTILASCI